MRNIIDLSHRLGSGIPIYPGDPAYTCAPAFSIEKDGYSVHAISLGSHTGTHIDAPSHFIPGGKTIEQVPLDMLVGPAVVIDLTNLGSFGLQERQKMSWADIQPQAHRIQPGVIVLLRTGWSAYWGSPKYFDHPFLCREAAEKILALGVRVIGIDTLSPDETRLDGSEGEGFGVHEAILGAGGVIAENLTNLGALNDDDDKDTFIASLVPLNIGGCDGSPVRAIAWRETSN